MSYWTDPMDESTARNVLGNEHFDWIVSQGVAACESRASGSWYANLPESFGAYKAAALIARAATKREAS